MKIIQEREIEECESYSLEFDWRGHFGWGFSFPCDAEGNPDWDAHKAGDNLCKCLLGEHDVVFRGVRREVWTYRHAAVGRCVCGEEVVLDGFTNTCDGCERDYNSSGQELAPRSQWGEETGESLADILSIP